jgi:hypothetical protein
MECTAVFFLAHAFQKPTLFIHLKLNTQPNHSNKYYRCWVNGNAIFIFILNNHYSQSFGHGVGVFISITDYALQQWHLGKGNTFFIFILVKHFSQSLGVRK